MSGSNVFATTGRHQLLVKGAAGDSVDLAEYASTSSNGGWTKAAGTQTIDGVTVETWNHTSLATVYVQQGMSVV